MKNNAGVTQSDFASTLPKSIPIATPTNMNSHTRVVTSTVDPKNNWNTYSIPDFGLQFSLPKELYSGQGSLKETIGPGESGDLICVYFDKATRASSTWDKGDKSTGHCWINDNDLFILGGDSVDFEAGRSGSFMDTLGFTQKQGKSYQRLNLNRQNDISSFNPQLISNPNGVEVLKIVGHSTDLNDANTGIDYTLANGWIGALINTKKTNHPGLGLQIKLTKQITMELFDKIMLSFKFIN